MALELTSGAGSSAHDPDERYRGDREFARPKHKRSLSRLDRDLLGTLQGWWDEARDCHAANRREQLRDADYYDHHQWDRATADVLMARGQAPLTYNLVKPAVDWIIGTERRTRIDWKVHPRGPEDNESAQAKQQVLKYVDDVNSAGFARSAAFSHQVKVGIGWTEECLITEADEEPITVRHEDWKNLWWDPYARKLDLSDARYITRGRWLDVDYAVAMFPQHEALLRRHSRNYLDAEFDLIEDLGDVPGLYLNGDRYSLDATRAYGVGYNGIRGGNPSTLRHRVRMLETWFKRPVPVKRMASLDPDLDRGIFDEANEDHQAAVNGGYATLVDSVQEKVFMAIWIPGHVLQHQPSPYRHNRYPFTPYIAFRDDRTGLPYGVIRGMRDPQDDYNKRVAKTLFLLSTNRVIYEDGAFNEGDEDTMLEESAAPDAKIRLAKGALADKRIQFEWGAQLAAPQVELMSVDREQVYEGNGITRENLGQETNSISGRAILAKQQQGSVTTAELFDNYRFGIQCSGRKTLSLVEQFMTLPKRLRILGPKGKAEWLMVNEPMVDPATGEVFFNNDLAKTQADFIIDQQDQRETMRMAWAESLFETMKGLPPEAALAMLDVALELTDLPNRDDLVRRVRQLNGQSPPGEEDSPEAIAAELEKKAAQQRQQQLEEQERTARIRKDMGAAAAHEAAARQKDAQARRETVQGKREALDTAAVVQAALPLAPAADRLYQAPTPPPTT